MDLTAKIITPEGRIDPVEPKNGKTFELEELQGIVGGFIEVYNLPGQTGAALVMNEEGKLQGLAVNELATRMWHERCLAVGGLAVGGLALDQIVGTVLLCRQAQMGK